MAAVSNATDLLALINQNGADGLTAEQLEAAVKNLTTKTDSDGSGAFAKSTT